MALNLVSLIRSRKQAQTEVRPSCLANDDDSKLGLYVKDVVGKVGIFYSYLFT